MTILASDIARAIHRPGDDPITTLTRIRNWTKFGLLRPLDDGYASGGRGRAFRYAESAIIDAAIIQSLVNAGVSTISIGPLLEQLKSRAPELFAPGVFQYKAAQTLLVLSMAPGGNTWNLSLRSVDELARYIARHMCSQYLIVDLEKLREMLTKDGAGGAAA